MSTLWKPIPQKMITFEKHRDLHGKLPVGATFDYTYKSLAGDVVRQRAIKAFHRNLPDEDVLDWKIR